MTEKLTIDEEVLLDRIRNDSKLIKMEFDYASKGLYGAAIFFLLWIGGTAVKHFFFDGDFVEYLGKYLFMLPFGFLFLFKYFNAKTKIVAYSLIRKLDKEKK